MSLLRKSTPSTKRKEKQLQLQLEAELNQLSSLSRYLRFLDAMAHFNSFSCLNIMRIHMQKPGATRIDTFKGWKKQGRVTKSGTSSFQISVPVSKTTKDIVLSEKIDPETGEAMFHENGDSIMEEISVEKQEIEYTLENYFDISQTKGEPVKTYITLQNGTAEQQNAVFDAISNTLPPETGSEAQKGEIAEIMYSVILSSLKAKEISDSDINAAFVVASATYVLCRKFGAEPILTGFDNLEALSATTKEEFLSVLDEVRKLVTKHENIIKAAIKGICTFESIEYETELTEEKSQQKLVWHEEKTEYAAEEHKSFVAEIVTVTEEKNRQTENEVEEQSLSADESDSTNSTATIIEIEEIITEPTEDANSKENAAEIASGDIFIAKEQAKDCFKNDYQVYAVTEKGEILISDPLQIEAHAREFLIDKADWLEYSKNKMQGSLYDEASEEQNYLYSSENMYAIYQLKDEYAEYKGLTIEALGEKDFIVERSKYRLVFTAVENGELSAEKIYTMLLRKKPEKISNTVLEIGDIISVKVGETVKTTYINKTQDGYSFIRIISFIGDEDAVEENLSPIESYDKTQTEQEQPRGKPEHTAQEKPSAANTIKMVKKERTPVHETRLTTTQILYAEIANFMSKAIIKNKINNMYHFGNIVKILSEYYSQDEIVGMLVSYINANRNSKAISDGNVLWADAMQAQKPNIAHDVKRVEFYPNRKVMDKLIYQVRNTQKRKFRTYAMLKEQVKRKREMFG